MAFMQPEYIREDFVTFEDKYGETHAIPDDCYEEGMAKGDIELIQGKMWARLSAPGYMDATDWMGPFDTIDQAMYAIKDTYDVDPWTGDDLPESESV